MDKVNFLWTIHERVNHWIRQRGASRQNHRYSASVINSRQDYLRAQPSRGLSDTIDPNLRLSVSVVLHNNSRYLDGFLRSLLRQKFPAGQIELYVVDNGSDADEKQKISDILHDHTGEFRALTPSFQENSGYGGGHDPVLRAVATKYALVTNVDLEFLPDSITSALQFALEDSDEVAAWEFRQVPLEHPKYYDPVTLETAWNSHACVLMRTDHYVAVNGYEPKIFMYGEDVELSYRFRRQGYTIRYLPHARVEHDNVDRSPEATAFQVANSIVANYYIRLRYGNSLDRLMGFLLLASAAAGGVADKASTALLRSYFWPAVRNTGYFLSSYRKSAAFFPFRVFDYELTRFGAERQLQSAWMGEAQNLPRVSIITRTYAGRTGLLKECMKSVEHQTYPNIEHVIVEDGGNSYEALVQEHKLCSGGRLVTNYISCEKVGRSAAGNQAMAAATGDYITILDDDDLLFADHIESLVEEVRDKGVDGAYSIAWDVYTKMTDRENGIYEEVMHTTPPIFYQEFDRKTLAHHNFLPIQSVLFKRALFTQLGGFNEDLSALEDWVLWKKYAVGAEFSYVPKLTSMFRTPANPVERAERHAWLHAAYETASQLYKKELIAKS